MMNKTKRSRKYISFLLTLVLLFCMSPFAYGVANYMGITTGTDSGLPGETVSVDITLSNVATSTGIANGLYNGNFKITYDSSALTVGTVTRGALFPNSADFSAPNTSTPGQITFLFNDDTGGERLINSDGVIATINFTINADVEPGDYSLAFAASPFTFYGLNTSTLLQSAIFTTPTNGKITVLAGPTAPVASNVNITGNAVVGDTLTGHYTYSDANGDSEGVSTFKWYRCDAAGDEGTAITDATAVTYQPVADDAGKYLKFEVTPISTVAPTNGTPKKSAATAAVTSAPTFVLSGTKVDTGNSRIIIQFDQPVYGDAAATTPISKDDLIFTYDGHSSPLTNVTVGTFNNNNNAAPVKGDFIFIAYLTLGDNGGKATGAETFTITPKDGASIYNVAGLATPATATTGPLYLHDTTLPTAVVTQGTEQDPGTKDVLINVFPSENVNWWIVFVDDGAPAPSIAQVKAGQDSTGTLVDYLRSGTPATPAGYGFYATLSADNTNYDGYMVVRDAAGNDCSSPILVDLTTPRAISTDATVTSTVYTVSNTGAAGTISGVPYNTSKTNFLASLTKGFSQQNWNDTNIADPVVTGNTLIVTAEDGTTTITYSVAVNAPVMVSTINVTGDEGVTSMLDNAHGGSLQMYAEVLPNNAYNKAVTWSVTPGTGTAYIDPSTGLLNQGTVGTVTVRATAQDGSAAYGELGITVRGVRMSTGGLSMYVSRTFQLTAESVPTGAPITQWASSNPSVASVDSNGLVTANAVGSANITARTADGREGITTVTTEAEPPATLDGLTISNGTLTPAFSESTYDYRATVANSVRSITITATPYAGTTVTGDGVFPLSVGTNVFEIEVSGDDYTTATYTITITRRSSGDDGGGGGGGGGSDNDDTIDGEEGGDISDDDNGLDIDFPAGVMDDEFTVTIVVVGKSGLNVPDNAKIIGKVLSITKDEAGDFDKPVTITMEFDPDDVDFDKETLSLYYYNSKTGKWVELQNVKVDKTKHTVSGQVTHFTNFAILATQIPVTPPVTPPVVNPPATPALTDVAGHWAAASITKLVNSGAIAGYPDNTFRPDATITRAEFATILVKAFKLTAKDGKVFNDTANHWAKANIATAQAYGIISGYSDTKFGPDDKITREQMASMVIKAAKLAPAASAKNFKDSAKIAKWAQEAVATAVANGIIAGYPDNTFKPQGSATRAEAVTVIVKAMK